MFIFFICFASVGHFVLDVGTPTNTPGAGKGMIVLACLFITTYAVSLYNLPQTPGLFQSSSILYPLN